MKNKLLISIFLLSALTIYGGADLLKFGARSSGGNVVVNWQTSTETNVKEYIVERKTVNGSYIPIGSIETRTDKNYEFIDKSAFKSSDQLYIYRLKIVDTDGTSSYSWDVAVPHNVSSVKRTWGSIKALFR
jgi:hypothetical protein